MPRTVRISPVPIPPPPVAPRARRRYGGVVGAALLVLAVVSGVGHVLLSGAGSHSWDRHATPPADVVLTAGTSYSVSTADGPGVVANPAPLACTYTGADGAGGPVTLVAENSDSRATHAVARFVSPVTGRVSVGCTGGAVGSRPVFVDDADDAGSDLAGWTLLLAVLAGVAGVGLVLGASYRRLGVPRVSGVTADPAP